jgi:cell wall-associated NlpC family hydrolase
MNVFSQEKPIKHTVKKGETISKIAEKYDVQPKAIYELNPKAKKGIQYNTVLLIPTKSKKTKVSIPEIVSNNAEITHEVLSKETLWGIAKQYNLSVQDLYKINPDIEKEGLKKGQIIKIPQKDLKNLASTEEFEKPTEPQKPTSLEKNTSKEEIIVAAKTDDKIEISTEGIVREVLPKETLYSIAKQYGITIKDLQKANPTIESRALKAGQKIIIPVKGENNSGLAEAKEMTKSENKSDVSAQTAIENNLVETEITHKVLPKETKYGIAKQYGITVAELEKQNPKIVKKLSTGSVLKIQTSKLIETEVAVEQIVVTEKAVIEESNVIPNGIRDEAFVDQLISKASENIGTRYRSGGTTKEGFDCSGLMFSTFSTFDIKLPRSSVEMASYGSKINIENAQKGDLIFFKTRGSGRINHVGMVVEVCEGEIKFIHSATHGGVIISSTKESYYERNLAQINRVL